MAFAKNSFRLEVLKSASIPLFQRGTFNAIPCSFPPFFKGGSGDYEASQNGKNF